MQRDPSRPYCANCQHTDHTDGVNGDYCFKLTTGGLCGCTKWDPVYDEWSEDDEDEYDEEEHPRSYL